MVNSQDGENSDRYSGQIQCCGEMQVTRHELSRQVHWIRRLFLGLLAFFLILLVSGRPVSGQTDSSASSPTPSAAVMLDGRALFYIQVPLAGYPPETRAQATSRRLKRIAQTPQIAPEEIAIQFDADTETSDIVINDEVLVYVTEADARAAQSSRHSLASYYLRRIRSAILQYRADREPRQILRAGLYVLLLTLGIVLLLWLLSRTSYLTRRHLVRWKGHYIPALRVLNTEILSADRVTDALWELFKLTRLGLLLLAILLYVSQTLSAFPWTRVAGDQLFNYLTGAAIVLWNGFVNYLPNLFFIVGTSKNSQGDLTMRS